MALTYSRFNSFDAVVTHYDNTAPLRGKDNAAKDIRPIGDRARKWERIVKISPNCYALSDGYHFGDAHFGAWQNCHTHKPTLADMCKYAPIVWRKKRDGTEEVTLRNGHGDHSHNGRYAFLYRHTPQDMWFRNRNGKHFIEVALPLSTYYYLAKTRTTPKPVYDNIKERGRSVVNHYTKRHAAWVMKHDDNSAVVFRKNEHGGWDHVEGTGRNVVETKGPTVNKEVKAKYKSALTSFFRWGITMSPLLPLEDEEYVRARRADILTDYDPKKLSSSYYHPLIFSTTYLRKVLVNENHPMRLALWVIFASNCTDKDWGFNREYYTKTIQTKEDLQRVQARYNTWANKSLGFMNKKGN